MANQESSSDEPIGVGSTAYVTESGETGAIGVARQGNDAVLVAQFSDMDTAKIAYGLLRDAEAKRAIDIQGVLVVNADYSGKIHIQKMTDHTTRNGAAWGAVAGVVVGLIFPPSILAGAIGVGAVGAVLGKGGNQLKKGALAKELGDVIAPGTSGIVALVAVTAVDAVKETLPEAQRVRAVPVDEETADAVRVAAGEASGTSPAAATT